VGPEVVQAAAAALGSQGTLGALVGQGVGDRQHLDLAGLCREVLRKTGIERVDVVGGCTVTQPSLYFSHRRDKGITGRQLSAIARTTPPRLDDESLR
jgi:copper oxidase (laccase) domain-containing protein